MDGRCSLCMCICGVLPAVLWAQDRLSRILTGPDRYTLSEYSSPREQHDSPHERLSGEGTVEFVYRKGKDFDRERDGSEPLCPLHHPLRKLPVSAPKDDQDIGIAPGDASALREGAKRTILTASLSASPIRLAAPRSSAIKLSSSSQNTRAEFDDSSITNDGILCILP